MLKVLFTGEHTNYPDEGYYRIDPLTSSSTYAFNGTEHFLFDVGALAYQDKLLEELAALGVTPEQIDRVFLTHYHIDHSLNLPLFKNAKIYTPTALYDLKTGAAKVYTDLSKREIPKEVRVIETPGHTPDHHSYLYEENSKKYIIAGDAVREDLIRTGNINNTHDKENAIKSMQKLFTISDIIIPGHGRVIEGDLYHELKPLVDKFS